MKMEKNFKNLNNSSLKKALNRLKKDTRNFTALVIRDTTDYVDFQVNQPENIKSIIEEIISNKYHPQRPYLHQSAKSKGINRPTVVLDIKDALVYRYCIEQIEDELINVTRQTNIRGGKKITAVKNAEGDDYYEKWFDDWMEHQEELERSLTKYSYAVTTDIASYFENIHVLVLKDLLRSDVSKKDKVLNLLFYILENTRFRYDYEVNTFVGLPQEDIDCSRLLAYFFLHPHDEKMGEFCNQEDVEYYRFVDDMVVTVNSECVGRRALKCMTESLRRLNLVASIEKTNILTADSARRELFFEENNILSDLNDRIVDNIYHEESIDKEFEEVSNLYLKWMDEEMYKLKNWIKVLKRFYTISTLIQSDFLLEKIKEHIITYPVLFMGNRIAKYLLRTQGLNDSYRTGISDLIDYLYSEENLYPAVESNIIEFILMLDSSHFGDEICERLKTLSNDIFFKNDYKPNSDYTRALSCLLYYKYNFENLNLLANHYVKKYENDFMLRKYLIFVSLTVNDSKLRNKVLFKSGKEQNYSINRLLNLIENIGKYLLTSKVKNYLKRDEITIFRDDEKEINIKEKFNPIRAEILSHLIKTFK